MSAEKRVSALLKLLEGKWKSSPIDLPPRRRYALRSLGLHHQLGGGLPSQRFIEIHGESGAGKTTALLEMIRDVVDAEMDALNDPDGRRVIFMDHEGAIDLDYAARVTGVRWGLVERLSQMKELWAEHPVLCFIPPFAEFDMRVTSFLLQNKLALLTAHDSLAAMTPRALLGKTSGEGFKSHDGVDTERPAMLANFLAKWLPAWQRQMIEADCCCLYTNHAKRKSIGATTGWGPPPLYTVGGDAPKFFASVRLQLSGGKGLSPTGSASYVKVLKNKTSRHRNARLMLQITGTDGYDYDEEALRLATLLKIIRFVDAGGRAVLPSSETKVAAIIGSKALEVPPVKIPAGEAASHLRGPMRPTMLRLMDKLDFTQSPKGE